MGLVMWALMTWLDELGRVDRNLVVSVAVVVSVLFIRWLVLRVVHRRIDDAQVWFRTRKWGTYVAFAIVLLALTDIWLGGIDSAITYVGIVSAGIAIALTDVLKNLAGWAYILFRRPFRVGDRIEVVGCAGDVVDVRVFRFTLLEIGNWVDADQSTGRLIHIPNGVLFTEPVANSTDGFPFIWDEIPVLVTFESDWEAAERLVLAAVTAHAPDTKDVGFGEQIRRAAQDYFIRYTHLGPTVYVSVKDSGVMLTGRYLVLVRSRRAVQQDMWKVILRSFAERADIDLAYPTIRAYLPDRLSTGPQQEPTG